VATLADEVLGHLRGAPVEDRRVCLVFGCFDAAQLRAVHAFEHDEVAARIEDGDDRVPLVLRRLGLCADHHLLGLLKADRDAVGDLRRRRRHRLLGSNGDRRDQLLYVSISRARVACVTSYADRRVMHGAVAQHAASRFANHTGGAFQYRAGGGLSPQEVADISTQAASL